MILSKCAGTDAQLGNLVYLATSLATIHSIAAPSGWTMLKAPRGRNSEEFAITLQKGVVFVMPLWNMPVEHIAMLSAKKGDCGKGPWNPTDRMSCISVCRMWPAGATDDLVGNTLACRLHYVNAAEQSLVRGAKKLFCPNAALDGGGACTSAAIALGCKDLCTKLEQSCKPGRDTGIENGIFPTTSDCLKSCEELQPDTAPTLAGPTIGCFAKYVAVATRCTAPAVPCHIMKQQCFSDAAAASSEL